MKKQLYPFLILLPFFSFSQTLDTALVRAEVDSLFEKVDAATKQRNFEQTLSLLDQAEKKILTAFGKESGLFAKCLDKRGIVFFYQGSLTEVDTLWQEALSIQEKVFGKEHPNYATSLTRLGILYKNMGNYEKSESLYLQALAIREKVLGKEHLDYAHNLNYLGLLFWTMGNYEKAEPLYQEALAVKEKVLGKEHPDYARSLSNLGVLYANMGHYEKSEPLFQEALAIREKVLGKEHFDNVASLIGLGALYNNMGHYEKSESLYQEALAIQEKMLGKEHPDYALCLNNLGFLYMNMGNYKKGEPLLLEALAIREKVLGKENSDYAQSLNNLGILYWNLGNYEKAEPLLLEALAIKEKVLGKENPNYARSLSNLGNIYLDMGSYKKAEHLYQEALAIQESVLGKEHPEYAISLNNLGVLYRGMGRYEKGEHLFQEALAIQESVLGKEHPEYAISLNNLGVLYQSFGNYEKSEPLFLETNEITRALLIKAYRHLSERELSAYIRSFSKQQELFFSFGQMRKGLSGSSYNNALFHKGFVLNAIQNARRLAQSDSSSRELFLNHKSYLRRLAAEYAKPIAERKNVAELEEKANTLEKELIRTVAGYGEAIRQVEWSEVQAALQPGEAAIEFIHYNFYDPDLTDSVFYAALVLRPGKEQPHFIPLFEKKELTELLSRHEARETQQFVADIYSRGIIPAKKNQGEGLYDLIWRPLDSLLAGINTIYASPSGLLHRINLGAIRIDSGRTFTDKYHLSILGSTRQLIFDTGAPAYRPPLTATLYGGIRYDMDSTAVASAIRGETDDSPLSFSYLDRSAPGRGRSWRYLPATAEEADKIGRIIQSKGGQVQTYKGYKATEASFKKIGRRGASPRVLHLATHGYFYPDPEDSVGSRQLAVGDGSLPAFKISDHPMIRSGLILAGGNHAWLGNTPLEGREDGILTAYEISQMNLDSTELVVLSACETGLGDIDGNEGVYGLQRAFKIAGVKNIIMSLWSVPDQQTQEMMVAFYAHWLNEEMEIADAFRKAQRERRDKYEGHYYWAAFVLIE